MSGFSGFLVYVMVWWTALFCVLPIGTRPVEDPDPEAGGWRGAPRRPLLIRKLIGTTVLATVVWLVIHAVMLTGWVDFREGWWAYQGPGISSPMPGGAQR
jgi:predicted secreted protein